MTDQYPPPNVPPGEPRPNPDPAYGSTGAPPQPTGQPPAWTNPPPPPQQPPSGYAPPAGGYAPPPGPSSGPSWSGPGSPQAIAQKEASGFFAALFDYSFSRFVTPMIVKFLYILLTIAVVIGYLFYVIVAFEANAGLGVVMLLIIGPIVSIVVLAFYRVTLELYMAVVRMSEDIHRMQGGGRQL